MNGLVINIEDEGC